MMTKKIMDVFEEYCKKNKISGKERDEKLAKLESFIKSYIYEPGEAIGIIAAQSISEPTTQMSLDYGEKIILKRNGAIKIVPIGEFADMAMEKSNVSMNGWEICDLSGEEIYVPAISGEEKIEWKCIQECSRHKAPEYLIKIKTFSGREITATDSHSFVIRKSNRIVPVSGRELKTGHRLPVIKFLHENCMTHLELKPVLGEMKNIRKPMPEKIELNGLFGWLTGAYLAEGNCTKNYVSLSNVNEEFLSKVREFAGIFGFTYNEYDNFRGFAKGHDIRINSTVLSKLLEKTCGTGSNNKKVPDFAYSAEEKFVAGLIRGYFDGDGNVSVSRKMLRVSSNSGILLDGIKLLLARFGIFAHKCRGRKQPYLIIPSKYAAAFSEKIGLIVEHKMKSLGEMSNLPESEKDFTDMIGGFDDLLHNAAKKLNYPARYVNNFTKRQKIGRTVLGKYIKIFETLSKEKNVDVEKELLMMKQMFNSDVVWDEIVSIEKVKPSKEYVYDLSVPGSETFATFDGIITHNTMRSYTLASQSDRLSKVTQGLPRLIEIFDVRKTFEKNMMIYLREKYNTKEKSKEIANRIKSTKIADMLKSDSIDLVGMRIELEAESGADKENMRKVITKYMKGCEVTIRENRLFVKPSKDEVKDLRKIRNKILKFHVEGIKGIEGVVVIKEGEDWIIQTTGTNVKKVFELEEVDVKRTRTNDMHQVHEVLGVEAAHNVLLHEAKDTLDEQGLDVDPRHLILLGDTMTYDGTLKAIGRYGVSGKKSSVLSKANFEETKRHLINASFYGETDTLEGVIENVMIGQIAPIGTGMVNLTVDMEKMKEMAKKK